jgi:hypothetical protein
MATAKTPDYLPSRPPQFKQGSESDTLAQWIFRELRNLAQSGLDKTALELRVVHAPPPNPREGMIVAADGVHWSPDGSHQGGIYSYVNGQWKKLG